MKNLAIGNEVYRVRNKDWLKLRNTNVPKEKQEIISEIKEEYEPLVILDEIVSVVIIEEPSQPL